MLSSVHDNATPLYRLVYHLHWLPPLHKAAPLAVEKNMLCMLCEVGVLDGTGPIIKSPPFLQTIMTMHNVKETMVGIIQVSTTFPCYS